LRRRKGCTIDARKGAKVIIKAMIFLDDNDDMFDRIIRLHGFEDLQPLKLLATVLISLRLGRGSELQLRHFRMEVILGL
jgi:hypothetical protein